MYAGMHAAHDGLKLSIRIKTLCSGAPLESYSVDSTKCELDLHVCMGIDPYAF